MDQIKKFHKKNTEILKLFFVYFFIAVFTMLLYLQVHPKPRLSITWPSLGVSVILIYAFYCNKLLTGVN